MSAKAADMQSRTALPLLALMACIAAPALAAGTVIPIAPFHSIGLTGGAHVIVHYGTAQRVVLVKGSTEFTRIRLDEPLSGSLEIDSCTNGCPSSYDPIIEITTPDIEGLAVKGDGTIEVADGLQSGGSIGLAISGSGRIDARRLAADSAHVAIHGNGQIIVHARDELVAAVSGEGIIRYSGNPHVISAVNHGGLVEPGDDAEGRHQQ